MTSFGKHIALNFWAEAPSAKAMAAWREQQPADGWNADGTQQQPPLDVGSVFNEEL